MTDPLFLYLGVPTGLVVILAGTFLIVKRHKRKTHDELAARVNEELDAAANVDQGVEKQMEAPTDEEKAIAEREMWLDETK